MTNEYKFIPKTYSDGYHVVVYPDIWPHRTDHVLNAKDAREKCQTIMEEIKRHVNSVESMSIETENSGLCVYCSGKYEVVTCKDEDGEYYDGCCARAIADREAYDKSVSDNAQEAGKAREEKV